MSTPNRPSAYIPPRPDFEHNYPPVEPLRIMQGLPPVPQSRVRAQPSLGDLVRDQHDLRTARGLEEREQILRDVVHRRQIDQAKADSDTQLGRLLEEMQSDADLTAQEAMRAGLPPTQVSKIWHDNSGEGLPTGVRGVRVPLYNLFTDGVGHHSFQRKKIDPVYLAPLNDSGRFVTRHGFTVQQATMSVQPMDEKFRKHGLSRTGRALHFEAPKGIYEAGKAYPEKATLQQNWGEVRVLKVRTALARLITQAQDRDHDRS